MAITITSMNGLLLIKKIGIPQPLYDWLESAEHVEVKLSDNAVKFTVNGEVMHNVPVTLAFLQDLKAGKANISMKAQLSVHIALAIKDLMTQNGEFAVPEELEPTGHEDGFVKKLPKLVIKSKSAPAPAPVPAGKWAPLTLNEMKHQPPVMLKNATRMYQPVLGTSGGSRYYVVAANDQMRIAARYLSGKLSIRIEGPEWMKHLNAIQATGFEPQQSKGYASVHLAVPDVMMARKSLGAILGGLGVTLETPLPNFAWLAECG